MNKGIILAVVVIVAIIGVVALVMSNKKSVNPNSAQDTAQNQQTQQSEQPSDAMKQQGVEVGGAMMTPDKDIVDNAVNSNDHTTLVAAVKAAGLVETLKGKGPFTVFAPTNEAFNKLPAGTVNTLLKPENKAKLTSILTYHVVSGAYRAADLKDGMTLKTVEGENLTFTQKNGKWWVNNEAQVTIADVISSNGVTHVIDTVLMPSSMSGSGNMNK